MSAQCVTHLILGSTPSTTCVNVYRSGTVNSKSFIGKVLLRIKWNFELTVFELTVPDLYKYVDRKRFGCHAGPQEISRCRRREIQRSFKTQSRCHHKSTAQLKTIDHTQFNGNYQRMKVFNWLIWVVIIWLLYELGASPISVFPAFCAAIYKCECEFHKFLENNDHVRDTGEWKRSTFLFFIFIFLYKFL